MGEENGREHVFQRDFRWIFCEVSLFPLIACMALYRDKEGDSRREKKVGNGERTTSPCLFSLSGPIKIFLFSLFTIFQFNKFYCLNPLFNILKAFDL